MAGHSKWSNIKRKKGAADAKRGKIFTRIIKEINVAIKEGGGADPDTNAALRNAIANAKGVNMPKDNIKRAIKKASGADADNYEEVTFEGYGPNGIAFFIECTTDNTNRTVANIRAIFSKANGSLGKNGSLEFLFERKGVFTLEKEMVKMELEELELELIESGLESMESDDEFITIYTEFSDFGLMAQALEDLNIEVKNSTLERIPLNTIELPLEQAKQILDMEEKFEDDDDVQNVFHNMEVTDELIAAME
ncbi:MAG TPA: YebC/PmpR family DNA-binding transcriptional regulator [Flavobacteriaceae bacterium]|nr:YebC/PmpR family DNA-binding transcriptional regulator [Flavobacteriaceae bacterium]